MMDSSSQLPDTSEEIEPESDTWTAKAWVYFIWVVIGHRVYCKIGYSARPGSRFGQIIAGIPERPFRVHLLPCLNGEQAMLFERILHNHLKEFKTKGEWFTHPNAKHLYKVIGAQIGDVLSIFETFGYEISLQSVDMGGKRPVLYDNGYISHVIE